MNKHSKVVPQGPNDLGVVGKSVRRSRKIVGDILVEQLLKFMVLLEFSIT